MQWHQRSYSWSATTNIARVFTASMAIRCLIPFQVEHIEGSQTKDSRISRSTNLPSNARSCRNRNIITFTSWENTRNIWILWLAEMWYKQCERLNASFAVRRDQPYKVTEHGYQITHSDQHDNFNDSSKLRISVESRKISHRMEDRLQKIGPILLQTGDLWNSYLKYKPKLFAKFIARWSISFK